MASDHRAHANAPRVYAYLRERDNEVSVGLVVPIRIIIQRGRGSLARISSISRKCGIREGVKGWYSQCVLILRLS